MDKLEIIINKINDIEKQLLAINEVLTNTFGKEILLPVDPYFDSVTIECQGYLSSILFDLFDSYKNKDDESMNCNKNNFLEARLKLRNRMRFFKSITDSSDALYNNLIKSLEEYYKLGNDFKINSSDEIIINKNDMFPEKCPWTLEDLITKKFEELIDMLNLT